MAKFHINSNGDPKPCKATINSCQFGDGSLHFDSAAEARVVVEKLMENTVNPRLLEGKKRSLSELQAAASVKSKIPPAYSGWDADKQRANEQSSTITTPPLTNDTRLKNFVKKVSVGSFAEVPEHRVPSEVRTLFRKSAVGERVVAYLKDSRGDYKAVSQSKADGTMHTWSAPPTRDIPLKMRSFESMNMSVHPRGPKTAFLCAGCGNRGTARLADYSRRSQGDFRIRCASCGQLNKAEITYG